MIKIAKIYSEIELRKFIDEIVDSPLGREIYFQLMEDAGNTVKGIVKNLQLKGIKASKTRVYEEIAILQDLNLIKRVSKRPPIYTTVQTKENFENISTSFFKESRQILMKKWASVFPFLPADLKTRSSNSKERRSSDSLIEFNPYPVVDIYNTDKDGLKRYITRVFESPEIYISNYLIDTCLEANNLYYAFGDKNLEVLIQKLVELKNRFGYVKLNTISNVFSDDLKSLLKTKKLTEFYKGFFNLMDYEIRKPVDVLSSFVIGKKTIFYPIGIGGIAKKTFVILELRDSEIYESAKITFKNAWAKSEPVLKVENCEIVEI